jgi:hypothetical protein
MEYKYQEFEPFRNKGIIVETIVRDDSGQKLDSFKAVNQKDYSKILGIMNRKYGFKVIPYQIEEEKFKDMNNGF